jgi:hypothetical protein
LRYTAAARARDPSRTLARSVGYSEPDRAGRYSLSAASWANSFQKGNPGGPGRKPGSENVITRLVKDAISDAGEALGDYLLKKNSLVKSIGLGGFAGYYVWLGFYFPQAFATLSGRLIPIQVDVTRKDKPYRSLEDVQRAIAERGLPPELLKPVLQHYSADRLLKPVKQIDGEVAR